MAHKKGGGSSRNGRDSNAQRLGVKAFGGQYVTAGSIIVRQHGTKMLAGQNAGLGRDNTIFAKIDGVVTFEWAKKDRKQVSIYPVADAAVAAGAAAAGAPAESAQAAD